MPRGDQLIRQWRLLQRLGHSGGFTIAEGMRELQCSMRTVWRDLTALQESGFPVYNDPRADGHRSVWRLEPSFQQRLPLPLTLPEAVALLMSQRWAAATGPSAFRPAMSSLIGKLRALFGKSALDLIDRMADAVGVRAPGGKLLEPAAEHLDAIHTAIAERRSVELRYYSMSRDTETERRVDPYHVTWFDGGLYLVGHCHVREAVRIFAVERIRAVEPLAARFTRPADFDPERYLRDAWGIIQGDLVTVQVVFAPAVARYVRLRRWHPSQEVHDLPGGRLALTLRVADTLEVRRWLMGFGAEAEVLAPLALREALRQEAEAMVQMLNGRAKGSTPPAVQDGARAAGVLKKPPVSAGARRLSRAGNGSDAGRRAYQRRRRTSA
ncbi:MAG: WYL domain-containing protein [Candidatus Rokuibacteriota bacterium]